MTNARCPVCGYSLSIDEECPRCYGEAALAGDYTPPDRRKGPISQYALGLNYYFAGFSFLNTHRKLYRYLVIPFVINFLLLCGIFYVGYLFIDPILSVLEGEPDFWLWKWLLKSLYFICLILLIALDILVSLALTFILSAVVNSPFYEILSEKVEDLYLGRRHEDPWSWQYIVSNILIPLKESLKLALFEILVMGLLFLVSLFTGGLGAVLFALAGIWFAALAFFDYVMSRKGYTLAEKRRFVRTNPGFTLGFGTPVYFIPFITPFAVVGATLAFLRWPK